MGNNKSRCWRFNMHKRGTLMQKLTKKQFIKKQTFAILKQILIDILPDNEKAKVTNGAVWQQFPKASYFKNADSGVIRVGLSFKGVRKLVKKNPYITVDSVKQYFNVA